MNEGVVAYFKLLYQHLSVRTEKNNKFLQDSRYLEVSSNPGLSLIKQVIIT